MTLFLRTRSLIDLIFGQKFPRVICWAGGPFLLGINIRLSPGLVGVSV